MNNEYGATADFEFVITVFDCLLTTPDDSFVRAEANELVTENLKILSSCLTSGQIELQQSTDG